MGAPRLILVEGMIGSGKTPTAGHLAVELFDRYPFGKLTVPDPHHDWPASLRAICAAVRP